MHSAVELSKALISIPSITPDGSKVLDYVESVLVPLGFIAKRKSFSAEGTADVDNLFIRYGTSAPHFMFAGHVDVVPVGDASKWATPPFEPQIRDGKLYGRGTEDMKGAIACFMSAAAEVVQSGCKGSISLLLTSDEEGIAINGSRKLVPWLKEIGEVPDVCMVGEPTNPTYIGEMVKIGRRGSLYFSLEVTGKQGHVAYPDLADNPITMLVNILAEIKSKPLDAGNAFFLPTGLEITSLESSPAAQNVIPEWARAKLSVRYNTEQTDTGIAEKLSAICDKYARGKYVLTPRLSGEPFLTEKGTLSDLMVQSIEKVTGHTPALSTTGGTSDVRFIKDICPVVEFGTTGFTPHMVNECVEVADLELLAECYKEILVRYFA